MSSSALTSSPPHLSDIYLHVSADGGRSETLASLYKSFVLFTSCGTLFTQTGTGKGVRVCCDVGEVLQVSERRWNIPAETETRGEQTVFTGRLWDNRRAEVVIMCRFFTMNTWNCTDKSCNLHHRLLICCKSLQKSDLSKKKKTILMCFWFRDSMLQTHLLMKLDLKAASCTTQWIISFRHRL